MLTLPSKGFHRSVNAHNVNLAICCDWMEASALLADDAITGADIVDILRENEIYADQDFAWGLVSDAFSTIGSRARLMGASYPIEISSSMRLSKRSCWEAYSAYSFCLVLSLPSAYPEWARAFGADYTVQGELFEALTAESMRVSLAGWIVHATGWTRTKASRLTTVVGEVASLLGEATGDVASWSTRKAKEAGLDLLCFRPFPDGRPGIPVYLMQCASGSDWDKKLKSPDLRIWTKVVTFAADPKKAFSMPFALSSNDFRRACNLVDGLLIDRHRLLAPGFATREWLSEKLDCDLVEWLRPRLETLPST